MAGEEAGKPVNQMRDELANNYNFDGVDELTILEEVEDAYVVREVVNARINEQFNGVPFPLHKSSDMDAENNWTTIQVVS